MKLLENKRVLVTGGTGSLGKALLERAKKENWNTEFIIFSRDEGKQGLVRAEYPEHTYVLGDVAKLKDVKRVMHWADIVFHFAAYKQIPSSQVNVNSTIETNVIGSQNIAMAAIECGVERVVATSTDKSCSPANLYGASKYAMECIFVAENEANKYNDTTLHLTRYGNVICSNASVIPFFINQKKRGGPITVTHRDMNRFWISLDQAIDLVLQALETPPGMVLVPKAPVMTVYNLAKLIANNEVEIVVTRIRPGEKLNECMISEPESHHTQCFDDHFLIHPSYSGYVDEDAPYSYCTDSPSAPKLSDESMLQMIEEAGFEL